MAKPLRIVAGGSAADPPHVGHIALIDALLKSGWYDHVIWVPSGSRNDKAYKVTSYDREQMMRFALPERWFLSKQFPRFELNLQDIHGENTFTINYLAELQSRFPGADIRWVTGVDSIVPQDRLHGKCDIQANWVDGENILRTHKLDIVPRAGYPHPSEFIGKFDSEIQQNLRVLDVTLPNVASSEIRRRLQNDESPFQLVVEGLLDFLVAGYIEVNELYK